MRGDRGLVGHADDVETGFGGDSSVVDQPAAGVEDGQMQESVVGSKAGAPDHGVHVDGCAVVGERVSASDAGHSWQPVDARRLEGARSDTAQGFRATSESTLGERRAGTAECLHQRVGPGAQWWDMPDVAPSEVHDAFRAARGCAGEVQGDLGAGVAGADHQHRSVWELVGVAVGAGVKLGDLRVEGGGYDGHHRAAVRAGRDHDVASTPPSTVGSSDEQTRWRASWWFPLRELR